MLTNIVPVSLKCCSLGFLRLVNALIYHRMDESANRGRQIVTVFRHWHASAVTLSVQPVRLKYRKCLKKRRQTATMCELYSVLWRAARSCKTPFSYLPLQLCLKILRWKRITLTALIHQLQRLLTVSLPCFSKMKQCPCQWTNDLMDADFTAPMAFVLQFLATGNSSEWSFVSSASLEYLWI